MLTAILLAAALAGASDDAARPAPPDPARADAAAQTPPAEQEAGALEASSLSEADLASQAASLTASEDGQGADGAFAPAAQSGMALDQSRIENFTPPRPEATTVPGMPAIGFSLSNAFGR